MQLLKMVVWEGDVDNGRGYVCRGSWGIWQILTSSVQFCSEYKNSLFSKEDVLKIWAIMTVFFKYIAKWRRKGNIQNSIPNIIPLKTLSICIDS